MFILYTEAFYLKGCLPRGSEFKLNLSPPMPEGNNGISKKFIQALE